MEIKKTVLARGADSITDGVITRLTGLLECPEAQLAVRKAVRNFKRHYGREPETVQLAVSLLIPCRPNVNQRIQIPYWSFAAKPIDSKTISVLDINEYADMPDDGCPIELKYLGDGRFGLP